MIDDPLLARVLGWAIVLVLLSGSFWLVSRAVQVVARTAGHERAGLLQAVKDFQAGKKTYGVTVGWLAWHFYSHYKFGTPLDPQQIGEALGLSTIRMAIAKNQKTTEAATSTAEEVLSVATIAATRSPVTPTRVAESPREGT